MLKIENLSVKINDNTILNDFNIDIKQGEIHGIMGQNGTGKSTICNTIIGKPAYEVVSGSIVFDSKDLLKLDITERARAGIYLINQMPLEVPGVTNAEMLRIAISERTGEVVNLFEFNKRLEEVCDMLKIPRDFIHRGINEGMSGGERKKNELLHLWMLEPKFIILDELDSGLDLDSIKIVVESIKDYQEKYNASVLIITHDPKLLKLLNVKFVHILKQGKVIETGDLSLASKLEKEGYKGYE